MKTAWTYTHGVRNVLALKSIRNGAIDTRRCAENENGMFSSSCQHTASLKVSVGSNFGKSFFSSGSCSTTHYKKALDSTPCSSFYLTMIDTKEISFSIL